MRYGGEDCAFLHSNDCVGGGLKRFHHRNPRAKSIVVHFEAHSIDS